MFALVYHILTKVDKILVVYTKNHAIYSRIAHHATKGIMFI